MSAGRFAVQFFTGAVVQSSFRIDPDGNGWIATSGRWFGRLGESQADHCSFPRVQARLLMRTGSGRRRQYPNHGERGNYDGNHQIKIRAMKAQFQIQVREAPRFDGRSLLDVFFCRQFGFRS